MCRSRSDANDGAGSGRNRLRARRFQMALVLLFALTALVLASLGIYGVVAYMVTQRARRDGGFGLALGAQPSDVHRLVLEEGFDAGGAGGLAGRNSGSAGAGEDAGGVCCSRVSCARSAYLRRGCAECC